jgi:hypothetical protein
MVFKMSCDAIVCIENIVDIQATYYVMNLPLSELIKDILEEIREGLLPILEIRIFLHSLRDVLFTNEMKGQRILEEVDNCIKNQLYVGQTEWTVGKLVKSIIELQRLILWDYRITGF